MKNTQIKRSTPIAWVTLLTLMAISLPLSKFAMSVFQFLILGMWFWSGLKSSEFKMNYQQGIAKGTFHSFLYIFKTAGLNFVNKFKIFFKNPAAVALLSIYIIHVIGLFWTTDYSYAFKDLRIKLPLLMFPVVLLTMPKLSQKQFYLLIALFIASNFVASFVTYYKYLAGNFTDIRQISAFISHIRFSLNICISIFSLLFFVFKKDLLKSVYKYLLLIPVFWFLYILKLLESGISFLILSAAVVCVVLFFIQKIPNLLLKVSAFTIILLVPFGMAYYFYSGYKSYSTPETVNINSLPKTSSLGNPYWHDTIHYGVENGKYVGLYICEPELKDAWNKRSDVKYNDILPSGYELKISLIRYLSSKDLPKDAIGISKLSDKDIRHIQKGIANYNYAAHPGIKTRLLKVYLSLKNFLSSKDPNGSSILQRFEYWKTASMIISDHLFFGTGTGDINNAFKQKYIDSDSSLLPQYRNRSHNQYLSIFVALGLFGFIIFLFGLIYPPLKLNAFNDYFFAAFFLIVGLSMLTEDTLETQAGATFFAYFFSLLLFSRKKYDLLQ
ncbi:MAG: O-antigen ligase family protein [Hyphomicrobiales bacterium]